MRDPNQLVKAIVAQLQVRRAQTEKLLDSLQSLPYP